MSDENKAILKLANAAISKGNTEDFLSFCAEDIAWAMVGEDTLKGKEAVRQWFAATYAQPPKFSVAQLIAEGDYLAALGDITIVNQRGESTQYAYCDVWRFRDGKMVELRGFAIEATKA